MGASGAGVDRSAQRAIYLSLDSAGSFAARIGRCALVACALLLAGFASDARAAGDVEQACKEFAVFVADREIGSGARGTTPYKQLRNAVYKECLSRGGPPEQEPDESSGGADSNEAPLTDGGSTDGATGETQDGEGGKPGPSEEPEPGRGPLDPEALAQLCYQYGEAFALGRGMLPGGAAWDAIVGHAQGSCIERNGPTSPINHYDPCDYAGDLCGYGDTAPPTGTGGDTGSAPTTVAARCLAFAGAYLAYNAAGFELSPGAPSWNERLGEIAEHCRAAGGPDGLNLYTNEQSFCCDSSNTQTPRTVLLNQCLFYGQGFADWFSGVPRGEPGHAPVQEWGRMMCMLLDGAENAPYGVSQQPYCCQGVSGTNPQMVISRCQAYAGSMAETLAAYPGLASHFPGGTTSQQVYDICRERNGPQAMPFGSFSGASPWIDQAALDAAIADLAPPPGETSADCEAYGESFAAAKGLTPGQSAYAQVAADAGFACEVMGEAVQAPMISDTCSLYEGGCGYGDPYKAVRDEALEAVSSCWLYGAWHAERLEPRGSREWAEALAGRFWHCAGAGGASGSFETGYPETLPPRSLQPALATFLAGYIEKSGDDNQEAPPISCPWDPRCTGDILLAWCASNDACSTVIDDLPPPTPAPPPTTCPPGHVRIGNDCYSPTSVPQDDPEPDTEPDTGSGGVVVPPASSLLDGQNVAIDCFNAMQDEIDGGNFELARDAALQEAYLRRCIQQGCEQNVDQFAELMWHIETEIQWQLRTRCQEQALRFLAVDPGQITIEVPLQQMYAEYAAHDINGITFPEIDVDYRAVATIAAFLIVGAIFYSLAGPAVTAAVVVVAVAGFVSGGGGGAIVTQGLTGGASSSAWQGPDLETVCTRISGGAMEENPELGEFLDAIQPLFRRTLPNLRRTTRDFVRDICVLNAPTPEAAAAQMSAVAESCSDAGWNLPGGPLGYSDDANDADHNDTDGGDKGATTGSSLADPDNIDLPDDPDYGPWLTGVAGMANNCLRAQSREIQRAAAPYLLVSDGENLANAWTAVARACALSEGYAWPEGLGAPEWPTAVDSANQARAIAERFGGCLEALGPES